MKRYGPFTEPVCGYCQRPIDGKKVRTENGKLLPHKSPAIEEFRGSRACRGAGSEVSYSCKRWGYGGKEDMDRWEKMSPAEKAKMERSGEVLS